MTLLPLAEEATATNSPPDTSAFDGSLAKVTEFHTLLIPATADQVTPSGLVITLLLPTCATVLDTATKRPLPYVTEVSPCSIAVVRRVQFTPSGLVITPPLATLLTTREPTATKMPLCTAESEFDGSLAKVTDFQS